MPCSMDDFSTTPFTSIDTRPRDRGSGRINLVEFFRIRLLQNTAVFVECHPVGTPFPGEGNSEQYSRILIMKYVARFCYEIRTEQKIDGFAKC